MENSTRVAAIQLAAVIGNSSANMAACERLALQAVREGARWIALPEFFTTGVAWDPKIADAIEPSHGAAACFLRDFSKTHQVVMGGSFLCRLPDGSVRNRYQCYADGSFIGQHDKDLPTMWENAFYEGGDPDDTGVLGTIETEQGPVRIGAAVCWEFMRSQTAKRLKNKVDLIMAGSCWWSVPTNFPVFLQKLWEPSNRKNALGAVTDSARLIGAPVIHAAHCGRIKCPMPGLPIPYTGFFEGQAAIINARGDVIAHRRADEGEGIVCCEITLNTGSSDLPVPDSFWLRKRGPLAAFAWHHQRWLGRRWYRRHVLQQA